MKKLLLGVVLFAGLGMVHYGHGYIGHKHTVKDESGGDIKVRLDYHGASAIACRKDVGNVKMGESNTWKSFGCQLKKITITQNVDGKDVETSLNVKNASSTVAKQVGAGIAATALIATTDTSNVGSAFGTYLFADQLAKGDYTSAELVAYGSTSWIYSGPNKLVPVSGVTIYEKK